ncbi:MAG: retropepsin-like aspartic protease family protein [Rhizobiaceae bacterium]
MWRYVTGFAVISVVTAMGLDQYATFRQTEPDKVDIQQNSRSTQRVTKLEVEEPEEQEISYVGRKTRIKMDPSGHFVTAAKMNGRRVEVLVDTGATTVAINKSTARRLGILLKPSDFKHRVNTANGTTKAAAVVIDRIEIGRVRVKNVRAAVLSDRALDNTLLGMSFLGQLKGFEVKNRQLILSQ